MLEEYNLRLQKTYARIIRNEQRQETLFLDDAAVVVVAYGTMARIASQVVRSLRAQGKRVGLIRPVTLWPFPRRIFETLCTLRKRRSLLAVEMSYGQMKEDVELAVNGCHPVFFLGRAGGGIPTEEAVARKIIALLCTSPSNRHKRVR